MTATQYKNWLQAFDRLYEFYCTDGEECEDAAVFASNDADEIYKPQEHAA